MIENLRILAIVPARLDSKGLKQKNIKKLNGIPLINYSLLIRFLFLQSQKKFKISQ
jgi:CMP-N-acetylneuraminic acid synthetase